MDTLFPRLGAPGDELALEVGAQTLTSRSLARNVAAHQRRLEVRGITSGMRVGVWTQPELATMVTLAANAASGVVSVPLDPRLGDKELAHLGHDARPVVTFAADPPAVEGRLAEVPVLEACLEESVRPLTLRPIDDEPLLVLYTSGTTGLPKGAVLSSRNIAFDLDVLARAWAWTPADTVVHALPLFHVHGLVLGLFGSLRVGGALRWLPRFEPRELARAVGQGQTMLFAVPTLYHRLAEAAEHDDTIAAGLSGARLLVSGSAPLPLRDQLKIERLTGRRVHERYGLTETLINTAVPLGAERSLGSVGPPLEGIELRLVDDAKRPLWARDDTTLGEVQVRGPNVFLGYLNRPEATAAVIDSEGWFSTGDLGCLGPDGSLRIVGRRALDLIKSGGFKVGAGEVEAALLEHPLVREAAVIGVPDPDLGERIIAFVVASKGATANELLAFAAAHLTAHKRPRAVHLVETLPRNPMGKVVKQALKERSTIP